MLNEITLQNQSASALNPPAPPMQEARRYMVYGAIIIAVFFGAAGTWSALAPLSSAVIASAVVKVEGNRKSVQHLDGGIVKELRVKDGDRVETGETLIVLDDTQALGALNVFQKQYDDLRAQEVRLTAERDGLDHVAFPDELSSRGEEPDVATLLRAQEGLFASRRAALAGQVSLLREKIAQTREQISGSKAVLLSRTRQLDSTQNEVKGLRDLYKRGYVPRQRMLELERAGAELEGQVGESKANIAKAYQAISEATLQIAQLRNDRAAQIANDLREVQAKLAELGPRLKVARDTLDRTQIRAPYSGHVVGLTVFSVGGVINRGERIMDIVPENNSLAVEGTVNVEDIEGLHPGMDAQVRLTAYTRRSTPVMKAKITQVSADRLTDSRTGQNYYSVQAKIDSKQLAEYPNIRLFPGMPAMLVIPTGERTALDYLLKPFTESINRAMREK